MIKIKKLETGLYYLAHQNNTIQYFSLIEQALSVQRVLAKKGFETSVITHTNKRYRICINKHPFSNIYNLTNYSPKNTPQV